ncbi:hypothetical protein D3C87_1283460 [compost metagenome]
MTLPTNQVLLFTLSARYESVTAPSVPDARKADVVRLAALEEKPVSLNKVGNQLTVKYSRVKLAIHEPQIKMVGFRYP